MRIVNWSRSEGKLRGGAILPNFSFCFSARIQSRENCRRAGGDEGKGIKPSFGAPPKNKKERGLVPNGEFVPTGKSALRG
jgi:hypothetical protein